MDAAEDVRQRDQQDRAVDRRHQHPERWCSRAPPTCTESAQRIRPQRHILNVNVNLSDRNRMAVWTISAQEGAGSDQIAARLAAAGGPTPGRDRARGDRPRDRPGAPRGGGLRRDREAPAALARSRSTWRSRPHRVRLLSFRSWSSATSLPELARSILNEAARQPCVILAGRLRRASRPSKATPRAFAPTRVSNRRLPTRAPRRPRSAPRKGQRRPRPARLGAFALSRRHRRQPASSRSCSHEPLQPRQARRCPACRRGPAALLPT